MNGSVNGNIYITGDVGLFEAKNVNSVNVNENVLSSIMIGGNITEFL